MFPFPTLLIQQVRHKSFICVIPLIHMCDMTHHMCDMSHSYVWHVSFICVTWLIHMCDMTHSYVWHHSTMCVSWRIHMCDMYVCYKSLTCVACLIHMCHTAHSYVCHDSLICEKWLIHTCDMTQSYIWSCHEWIEAFRLAVCHSHRHCQSRHLKYGSLLQDIVCFIGLFCKRDL